MSTYCSLVRGHASPSRHLVHFCLKLTYPPSHSVLTSFFNILYCYMGQHDQWKGDYVPAAQHNLTQVRNMTTFWSKARCFHVYTSQWPSSCWDGDSDGWHSDASVDVIGMSWTCWRRENCTVTQPAASLRAASRSHAPTTCRLTCYRRKYQKRHCIHASDGWLVDWGLTALLTQLRSYRTFKVNARYDLMKDITPHIQVLFYTSRFPITQNVRDLNAADSCIRRINHNLGSFWSLQQHTDGCLWLARYDFLLVCYNDFKTIPGL